MAEATDRYVALMSLHPEWSARVFSGEKTVEFRKAVPTLPISHVVVYATKPVGRVVGYFTVGGIESAAPRELWSRFGTRGSISEERFMDYFGSTAIGYAITVQSVHPHGDGIPLEAVGVEVAPQSFRYMPPSVLSELR